MPEAHLLPLQATLPGDCEAGVLDAIALEVRKGSAKGIQFNCHLPGENYKLQT